MTQCNINKDREYFLLYGPICIEESITFLGVKDNFHTKNKIPHVVWCVTAGKYNWYLYIRVENSCVENCFVLHGFELFPFNLSQYF